MSPALFDRNELLPECALAALGIAGNPRAIVVTCDQGTEEWFKCRLGVPSASHAENIVTSTGKAATGKARRSYMNGLIAERLTGQVEMGHSSPAMERGTNLEPRARDWYAFNTGRDVQQVGFVYGDDTRQWGCSPDGLCADRLIEIKCPMHRGMIDTLRGGKVPTPYLAQIQMQLWVCGLPACDFVCWTPEPQIPSVIWTVEADVKHHAMLAECVPAFVAELEEETARIRAMQEG